LTWGRKGKGSTSLGKGHTPDYAVGGGLKKKSFEGGKPLEATGLRVRLHPRERVRSSKEPSPEGTLLKRKDFQGLLPKGSYRGVEGACAGPTSKIVSRESHRQGGSGGYRQGWKILLTYKRKIQEPPILRIQGSPGEERKKGGITTPKLRAEKRGSGHGRGMGLGGMVLGNLGEDQHNL